MYFNLLETNIVRIFNGKIYFIYQYLSAEPTIEVYFYTKETIDNKHFYHLFQDKEKNVWKQSIEISIIPKGIKINKDNQTLYYRRVK